MLYGKLKGQRITTKGKPIAVVSSYQLSNYYIKLHSCTNEAQSLDIHKFNLQFAYTFKVQESLQVVSGVTLAL